MAKIIHTATGPNGEKFTRTSKSRAYSHVAIGRRSYDYALMVAKRDGTDRSNFAHYAEYVAGTSQFLARGSWEKDEAKYEQRKANDIARAVEMLNGCTDADSYAAMKVAERVAKVEEGKAAGVYDRFEALGWSSRHDLAVKVANGAGNVFAEARVLEVAQDAR